LKTVEKDVKVSVTRQVADALLADIQGGVYPPGRRIPGERVLAERFKVNRKSVIGAIELLEKDNYVEKIPAKGTFVADDIDYELSRLKIAVPFPEPAIAREYIGCLETWFGAADFHAGIMAQATAMKVHADLFHLECPRNEIQMKRAERRLDSYDGAVFFGNQHGDVRSMFMSSGRPAMTLFSAGAESEKFSYVTYAKEKALRALAAHLICAGKRRLGVLSPNEPGDVFSTEKIKLIMKYFTAAGGEVRKDWLRQVQAEEPPDFAAALDQALPGDLSALPEVFFCVHAELPLALWKVAAQRGWKPGADIDACALASGITLRNMTPPPVSYARIPFYEMGKAACAALVDSIRNHDLSLKHIILDGIIIDKGDENDKTW